MPVARLYWPPQRLHSKAGYMAAPERFAERSDSFPLHRGRRPYMALRVGGQAVELTVLSEVLRTWKDVRPRPDTNANDPEPI